MSEPEDIPQDVLGAAGAVWEELSVAFKSRDEETAIIARAIMAERKRAAGAVEALIESLNEGLMTDSGLTDADIVAMKHQVEALETAAAAIRGEGA